MFVDNFVPKWSSVNSLSASLRVQKILYQLSPTCVCPNFAGMVQELEHNKSNSSPLGISDGRPRNLIAHALETSRSLSFDSKLPLLPGIIKFQNRKRYLPRLVSDDLVEVEKLSDIEMLFQNPERGSWTNPRTSFSSRKSSVDVRRSLQYRSLAEGSVKLAMSFWTAGRQDIPKIRIYTDNSDDPTSCIKRSNSLNCIELDTFTDSKMRALSDELLPIPSTSTAKGISYSSEEFDELRASVYSIHGSAKGGSLSTMSLVVLPYLDSTNKEYFLSRRCRSLSDIERKGADAGKKWTKFRGQSDCYINKLDKDVMTDLFETANILGKALERHLKQQNSAQTV